ncbi:MAG: sigma-54 dependent transcriptional regulator [Tagaea sp.]|nr:sigma-54 dependent transcriptional regulator [Tagaea sp.]
MPARPLERDSNRPVVALVEDDPIMGESLVQWLAADGFEPVWLTSGAAALAAFERALPDAVLCDIRLPDMTGEELHAAAAARLAGVPIVFMTAYGDIPQAVRLMKAGAADYQTKPFDVEHVLARLRALLAARPAAPAAALGVSPAMRALEATLRKAAGVGSTVLISGESGVGKEIAARFLHDVSPRAGKPFVALNCAAIPGELLESELFGHERGAFTGAAKRHEGHVERAGEGTLFLDEIGELPPALQPKLLRLLQEKRFARVGGSAELAMRARVVAATNADLAARVLQGRFREDLYYRLAVIPIVVPPLRERPDDVLPLAHALLARTAASFGRQAPGFTSLAERALLDHDWPGNVRELANRIERALALALAQDARIGPGDLFPERAGSETVEDRPFSLAEAREAAERREIAAALAATGNDVGLAAQRLDVSRSTLFEKIKRLGIRA